MKVVFRVLLVSLFAVFLSQCGGVEDADQREQEDETTSDESLEDLPPEYRYRFRHVVGGIPCDTGEHVLTDKLAYCRALTDDRLNRGCAVTARQEEFSEQCQDVAYEWPR